VPLFPRRSVLRLVAGGMRLQYFTAICGSPIVNLGRTGLDGKMLHGAPWYGSTCLNSMMLHGASWYGSATCAPLEVDPCTSWLHQRMCVWFEWTGGPCAILSCFTATERFPAGSCLSDTCIFGFCLHATLLY